MKPVGLGLSPKLFDRLFKLRDTDLEEHEPLHGLVPLQQDDPRLQSSTQILVARVGISHCDANKSGQIPVKTRILAISLLAKFNLTDRRVHKQRFGGRGRSPMQHL